MRQGFHGPSVCAELQFSISSLSFGIEINVHACPVALTQIENTADDIDGRKASTILNTLFLDLVSSQRPPIKKEQKILHVVPGLCS